MGTRVHADTHVYTHSYPHPHTHYMYRIPMLIHPQVFGKDHLAAMPALEAAYAFPPPDNSGGGRGERDTGTALKEEKEAKDEEGRKEENEEGAVSIASSLMAAPSDCARVFSRGDCDRESLQAFRNRHALFPQIVAP